MATGLAIMGFGGGAIIASPLENSLLGRFGDPPEDAIVGSFVVLGCIYFVAMMLGAMAVKVPAEGWRPEGWTPPRAPAQRSMITGANVTATTAIKTPQFWLLWTVLFCNVTAGIGILEQAAPMIQDFFGSVTAAAAAGFVGLLSLCNMSGRFVWSSTSDAIGRKPIYMGYLGIGAICYFLLATAGTASVAVFVILTGIILSFYGGGFATVPGVPQGPVRDDRGRRDPRPPADRVVGGRHRRAADRQRPRRPRDERRQVRRGPVHDVAAHHGRRPRRRLRRQPDDPAGERALPRGRDESAARATSASSATASRRRPRHRSTTTTGRPVMSDMTMHGHEGRRRRRHRAPRRSRCSCGWS